MNGLFRFNGDGQARCSDCVLEVLETNPGMSQRDWIADELGETHCDVCDCLAVR